MNKSMIFLMCYMTLCGFLIGFGVRGLMTSISRDEVIKDLKLKNQIMLKTTNKLIEENKKLRAINAGEYNDLPKFESIGWIKCFIDKKEGK